MSKGRWMAGGSPGVYSRFVDGDGTKFHVEKVQDVEPVLDWNKEARASGRNDKGFFRHVARIPMIVYLKWLNEGFDARDPNNRAELMRRLNSSDWRYLRTNNQTLRVDDDWKPA